MENNQSIVSLAEKRRHYSRVFGRELKRVRMNAGLTTADLAKPMGATSGSVAALEDGVEVPLTPWQLAVMEQTIGSKNMWAILQACASVDGEILADRAARSRETINRIRACISEASQDIDNLLGEIGTLTDGGKRSLTKQEAQQDKKLHRKLEQRQKDREQLLKRLQHIETRGMDE